MFLLTAKNYIHTLPDLIPLTNLSLDMEPYILRLIQIDRKRDTSNGDPAITHVYTFFAKSSKYNSLFKYIVRAEKYDDCFAIKYYCSRCKHSEYKYSRVLDLFSAVETKQIMKTCASVIPEILKQYPNASFAFNGSRTYDQANYVEGPHKTQRYRIYTELVRRLFGEKVFHITHFDDSSSCLFINRKVNPDIEAAIIRIYDMFADIYQIII